MDISFDCDSCGRHLVIDEVGAGIAIDCPECGRSVYVPHPTPRKPADSPARVEVESVNTTGKLDESPPRKGVGDFLSDVLTNLTDGLTGITASDKKQWALSIGYIFQRTRSGHFLSTLKREWNQYREAGRIKDEYQFSEQAQACLQEMLDFLDNDSPDEIRFTVLKKVFMVSATETVSDRDSLLPQQYMRLCRGLSPGEILILSTAYKMCKEGRHDYRSWNGRVWLANIANESGLKHSSLVEVHEDELIRKHFLSRRKIDSGPGGIADINMGEHFRLTDLGYDLCQFIDAYEPPEAADEPAKS